MGAAEEKGRFSDTTTGCSAHETSSLFTACWQPRSSERQPIWVQDKHLFPIKHLVVNHGHTRRCSPGKAFQKKYLKLIIPSTSPKTSVLTRCVHKAVQLGWGYFPARRTVSPRHSQLTFGTLSFHPGLWFPYSRSPWWFWTGSFFHQLRPWNPNWQ